MKMEKLTENPLLTLPASTVSKRLKDLARLIDEEVERIAAQNPGKKVKRIKIPAPESAVVRRKHSAKTRGAGDTGVGIVATPRTMLSVNGEDVIGKLVITGSTQADPAAIHFKNCKVNNLVFQNDPNIPGSHSGTPATLVFDSVAEVGFGGIENLASNQDEPVTLGSDSISLIVRGGPVVVDLKSALYLDNGANAVTEAFGYYADPDSIYDDEGRLILADGSYDRLTFKSTSPVEIRLKERATLDLSSLGTRLPNGLTELSPGSSAQLQISIGGKLSLVFREGTTLRFPSADQIIDGIDVILYVNDEAQLVFDSSNKVGLATARPVNLSLADADASKIKILGKGQIWINKDAKMRIMGEETWVSIRADEETPQTDITISLRKQSSFEIGSRDLAGGALEVGNPAAIDGSKVSFKLKIDNASEFSIGRGGFLGLGVGIVNKGKIAAGKEMEGLFHVLIFPYRDHLPVH